MKTFGLGVLIFLGLALIALAFERAAPGISWPSSLQFLTWGMICLFVASAWIYRDHKRRILTSDEIVDRLLLEVARRYKQTGSLDAVASEYRAKGASDHTLELIYMAPLILKKRGDAKVTLGYTLILSGLIIGSIVHFVGRMIDSYHDEAGVCLIGAGFGYIILGVTQRRAFGDAEPLR